jgi:hypothetical protein
MPVGEIRDKLDLKPLAKEEWGKEIQAKGLNDAIRDCKKVVL